jgi:hypothetical protein
MSLPSAPSDTLPQLPPEAAFSLADAADHWFRHILEGKQVRANAPRFKAKYIEDRLEAPEQPRPWKREISGRLLSKANDIAERAVAEASRIGAESIKFRHVAYVAVATVRQDPNWDVFAEPKDDDLAHANLVVYNVPLAPEMTAGTHPKIGHELVRGLADHFQVCDATDLSPIEALRV